MSTTATGPCPDCGAPYMHLHQPECPRRSVAVTAVPASDGAVDLAQAPGRVTVPVTDDMFEAGRDALIAALVPSIRLTDYELELYEDAVRDVLSAMVGLAAPIPEPAAVAPAEAIDALEVKRPGFMGLYELEQERAAHRSRAAGEPEIERLRSALLRLVRLAEINLNDDPSDEEFAAINEGRAALASTAPARRAGS